MPSTVIAEMNYDPRGRILSIRFRPSGRRYDYFEVPFEAYDALRHALNKPKPAEGWPDEKKPKKGGKSSK